MRKNKFKVFSGGMLRRIGIAQALLNNPEILVPDEPTILSIHIVSDVEHIADNMIIMKDGRIPCI